MGLLYTYLWKSALIILLFYGVYRLLLHKETYFQSIRYFLLTGIMLSFSLPLLIIPIYIDAAPIQFTEIATNTMNNVSSLTVSSLTINWKVILLYMYLFITGVLLIRFVFQLLSIASMIFKNKSEKIGNYYYVETNSKTSPFSFFNFIIYNPDQFTQTELEQILAHEKAHVIQKHSFDTLLSNFLIITQWYNPVSWLYKKDIEKNLEFIADELAQTVSNSNKSYQQLLLKTGIPNYQMALANNFYNSLLKNRIIMLHKKRSNSKSQWKIVLIVPLLLAFVFTFNTKVIAQQKKVNKKIEKIDVEVFAMKITKESAKDDLNEITKSFAKKGLEVNFKGLKRNSKNEITAIKIDAEADSGKASAAYATEDDEGINPIQISFDNTNNNLSIGSSDGHNIHGYSFSNKGNTKMIKHKGEGNSFIYFSDDDDQHTSTKVWVNKDGDTTKIKTKKMIIEIDSDHDGEKIHEIIIDDEESTEKEVIRIKNKKGGVKGNFVFISEDDDDDENTITTYIVNGQKMSKEAFKKFDKDKIKTIEIKKEVKKEK